MSQQLELLTENPTQWAAVTRVTPEIQKKQIKPFVALALKELAGSPDRRLASLVNADKYAAVRAVVAHLARLRSATAQPWGVIHVTAFVESLRFPGECVQELVQLLCSEQVYSSLPTHRPVKPTLAALHWKIDLSLRITISEDMCLLWKDLGAHHYVSAQENSPNKLILWGSHNHRHEEIQLNQCRLQAGGGGTGGAGRGARAALRQHAHVILSLQLSDGSTPTYRLPLHKFHELRFVVASALKAVLVVERRRALRRD